MFQHNSDMNVTLISKFLNQCFE